MPSKIFRSLDLYSEEKCEYGLVDPHNLQQLFSNQRRVSVMGAGRSLVGAGFGKGVYVLQQSTEPPCIEFDQEERLLRVSASATVGQVYNLLIAEGFILTGFPSYPGVTIGGCIAANVHGGSVDCCST